MAFVVVLVFLSGILPGTFQKARELVPQGEREVAGLGQRSQAVS